MFRGIDKMDPMSGIGEKRGPGGHGLEDTAFAFNPQILTQTTVLGEPLDQAGRLMGVEVIHHKDPAPVCIGGHGLLDMVQKVRFAARGVDGGGEDGASGNFKISH